MSFKLGVLRLQKRPIPTSDDCNAKEANKQLAIGVGIVIAHDPLSDPDERSLIPKTGDRVVALGQHGTFQVIHVHMENLTVDLKLIGPADCYEKDIPWSVLLFLDSECQRL